MSAAPQPSEAVPEFVHRTTLEHLPGSVVEQALRCLRDLIGVAVAGTATPLSRLARDHAARHFGAGDVGARMIFDGRVVSPVGAAFAGAMTIDSLDGHDGHCLAKGHAGVAVLPALLAFADSGVPRDGPDFLTTLVVGYEVGTRAALALHATAADYHSSGAWNAIAAAAVGARLLRLDAAATGHALGIAEYSAPRGLMMRCIEHPTMVKDGSGWGAMTGVSAALLAADGFTGAPAALLDDERAAEVWADLGSRWRIEEQYFKAHPVCRWAQPAVRAALELRERHALHADQIRGVEIETFEQACRLSTRRPITTEQAQYSLSFPVAAALVRGAVRAAEVAQDCLGDREVLRLSQGASVVENREFSDRFPAERWAQVSVLLGDGRRVTTAPTTASGDPDAPLTELELATKFEELTVDALGTQRSEAITAAVAQLTDPASGIKRLLDYLLENPAPMSSPSP